MLSTYLLDIIYLLIAAVITVPLFQVAKLGAVPGFLVAGIVVGPSGLGLINNVSQISHLAEIGVVFLLFVIGVELKPSRLWQMRKLVFGLGSLQILLSAMLISAAAYFLFNVPLKATILIGPALALSSTAFVLQLLAEQKALKSAYGRTSFAILLMQDLAVVPLLALIPLLTTPNFSLTEDIGFALAESLFILTLVILVGRYLLHPLLHRVALAGNPEIFTASALLLVLGTALVTEHAGLSMAMGAFLAGLLISDSFYRHQVIAEIHPFRGILLGFFFMSMGMSLNIDLFFQHTLLSLGLVSLLIGIKIVALYPLTFGFEKNNRTRLAIALILAQSGEFALVLFSLAFQSDIIDDPLFQYLLLVVLLSMLFTPFLSALAQWLLRKKEDKTRKQATVNMSETPVIIAGFGRVGRRIGSILQQAQIPFLAMDSDAHLVETQRENGFPVYYGDVTKPELLTSLGVSHAQVIIVTINDHAGTEEMISTLRNRYPDKQIYARGLSLSKCRELKKLGASGVVSENLEASLELARMALTHRVEKRKLQALLSNFRHAYHTSISTEIDDERG